MHSLACTAPPFSARRAIMPKRILVIGLLFVLCGLSAIWSIVEAAMHNRLYLNFAVFCLPVGIGLLRGKARSQWWARFWIILSYIAVTALICLSLISPENVHAGWFEKTIRGRRAVPWVIGGSLVFGLLLILLHRLLYSRRASSYLRR
ncbi:MAG TPA: hypothetical protein VG796_05735 [Verrucomicrobiales bacterium]|nr:hypothetical protein [Verrucomicrobiales bacterium]